MDTSYITRMRVQENRIRRNAHKVGLQISKSDRDRDYGTYYVIDGDGAIYCVSDDPDVIERYIRDRAPEDVKRLSDREVLKSALAKADELRIHAVGPTGEAGPLADVVVPLMGLVRQEVREAIVTAKA